MEDSILKLQVSAPADNEDMTKKQRENIIKKHMEQYTTKYYASDNRWHSFLPDEHHPRKMKPIAKRKREDLDSVIIDYYMQQEQSEKRKRLMLCTLYSEWFDYKWKDAMQFSGHRDVQTYIKHYCFSRYSDEQKRMELEKTLNVVPN